MPTAYLNIGSNKGDRTANISRAVALLSEAFPGAEIRLSRPFLSKPWGFLSDEPFVNLGVSVELEKAFPPLDILHALQRVERMVSAAPHRNADGSYCDREIDVDFIAYDCLAVNLPELILPHPRAYLRDFVMVPLAELAPAEVMDFVRKAPASR